MLSKWYLAGSIELFPEGYLQFLLPKDCSLREMHECLLRLLVNVSGHNVYTTKKIQFVINEKMIAFDDLLKHANEIIDQGIRKIRAIDSGINLLPDYHITDHDFSTVDIEVRRDIKRSLENLDQYKIQTKLISIYTELINYKGTDQLQQRKFKKMIEQTTYLEGLNGHSN